MKQKRQLRQWEPKYDEINLKDLLYQYYNEAWETHYIQGDEIVLSKDGSRLAVKASSFDTDSFYALYTAGPSRGKWDYDYRPGEVSPRRVIDGDSISLSKTKDLIAIGYSRCDSDSSYGYASGYICIHEDTVMGPNYDEITNSGGDNYEFGNTWGKTVSLTENGNFIAVGSSEGKVHVYNSVFLAVTDDDLLPKARLGDPIIVGDVTRSNNTFGEVVKMAGDEKDQTVVIGGEGDKVSVYRYMSSQPNSQSKAWSKLGMDIPSDGYGEVFDVSLDGNIVAVAYNETTVQVYQLDTNNDNTTAWIPRGQEIRIADKKSISLSLSNDGNILAVGAYKGNRVGGDPGYVSVYEFDEGNDEWLEMSIVVKGKEDTQDEVDFARSISLSGDGDILAVAAPGISKLDKDKGYAMVFEIGDPFPSTMPSSTPSLLLSSTPTAVPSSSLIPSAIPTTIFTSSPSVLPTSSPSESPQPSSLPSISTQPSHEPSSVPTTSPSSTPSFVPSVLPTPVPTPAPTSSTCLFNCDCEVGTSCDLSQCLYNCNCVNGFCNMSSCTYDCRCNGGNCNMEQCGSNCQCEQRGCRMDNCIYNSRCVSGVVNVGILSREIKGGVILVSMISFFAIML